MLKLFSQTDEGKMGQKKRRRIWFPLKPIIYIDLEKFLQAAWLAGWLCCGSKY
jgi:hypothetical protein